MNGGSTTALSVEGVSKSFRIATDPVHSIKERIIRLGRRAHVEFEALRGVDIHVDQGETVGILGHNGSGKSTLLKCIAGILTPTTGRVLVRGRLTSLLELGAGFHPELSGRENVYINAAFYGMSRRETRRRFADIVAFAELDRFIDEPVKHYSSGMYVRLGFAVAVNLEPDVLLVDEVLAVGDELFQAKCLSRIKQFQRDGRTIVFVTHDAATVRQICDRAIVVDHGRVVIDGTPNDAISTFREHLHGNLSERVPAGTESGGGVITGARLHHAHDSTRAHVEPGETVELTIDVRADPPIDEPIVGLEVTDRRGQVLYSADTDALGLRLGPLKGPTHLRVAIGRLWLLDGEFALSVKVTDRVSGTVVDWRERIASFEVRSTARAEGTVALDVSIAVDEP